MTDAADPTRTEVVDAVDCVTRLGLEAHGEGGFFRQTYESASSVATDGGERPLMNSIYYLLTAASPVGALHRNKSDIIHFHHFGGPATYLVIGPDGDVTETVLGADYDTGQVPSLTVKAGSWKTSNILSAGATDCLISEAVAPGFRYEDQDMATLAGIAAEHPDLLEQFRSYIAADRA